jgi:hypothetical protein
MCYRSSLDVEHIGQQNGGSLLDECTCLRLSLAARRSRHECHFSF